LFRSWQNPPSWHKKILTDPWERYEYLHVNPSANYNVNMRQFDIIHQLEGPNYDRYNDTEIFIGPSIYSNHPDSLWLRTAFSLIDDSIILPLQQDGYHLGRGLDLWRPGIMKFEDGLLYIPKNQPWFSGWYREIRPSTVDIDIRSGDGELFFSESANNDMRRRSTDHDWQQFNVLIPASGAILEMVREGYYFGNRVQHTMSAIDIDDTSLSLAASCLNRLTLLDSNGNPVNELNMGLNAIVSFHDNNCDATVRVEIAHWLNDVWVELDAASEQILDSGYTNFIVPSTLAA